MIPNFIQSLWTEQRFHWFAAVLGALVATWLIINTHGIINKDGALYVRVASLFVAGEWKQGIELYNWPFYSIILAAGHQLTGLHLQTVGHLLSIICFSLGSAAFVLILREAGGKREVMIAGLLLLLATPDLVGDVVPMLWREHGFMASLLWGLLCLLRFYNTNRVVYALGWGLTASLATLFRIEGISFLVLLPLALIFQTCHAWQARMVMFLKAQSVLLVCSVILMGILLLNPSLTLDDFGRLQEPLSIIMKVYQGVSYGLKEKAQIYGAQILGKYLEEFALSGLLLTLIWALLVKITGTAGIVQSILCACAFKKRHIIKDIPALPVLVIFILIAFINCVFILFDKFLLADRMTSPLSYSIILFAAFILAGLYKDVRNTKRKTVRIWFLIVSLLLAGQMVKTVWPPDEGDYYEINAVKWMEANKRPHEQVFYDSLRLRYYAGDYKDDKNRGWPGVMKLFENQSVENYQYLVVHADKRYKQHVLYISERLGQPIMQFDDGRKKLVLIYRVPHSPES